MATGSTDTFEESRDQICASGLENVGAIGPGETRNANNSVLFDMAARALNRVVKSIDKDGQRLWRIVRRTTTTTAATASFTLATDVLDLDGPAAYSRSGQTARTQILPMSRDDYMRLADRTTAGIPRQYYVERTLSIKTVYLWPVPDATGDTIEYAVALRGKDFTAGSDTPDFTSKWTSCLVYGLTVELAAPFRQLDLLETYKPLYEAEKALLVGDDTERGNVTFMIGYYGGGAG